MRDIVEILREIIFSNKHSALASHFSGDVLNCVLSCEIVTVSVGPRAHPSAILFHQRLVYDPRNRAVSYLENADLTFATASLWNKVRARREWGVDLCSDPATHGMRNSFCASSYKKRVKAVCQRPIARPLSCQRRNRSGRSPGATARFIRQLTGVVLETPDQLSRLFLNRRL